MVKINTNLALSTLTDTTVLLAEISGSIQQDFWAISADLTWSVRGLTAGEGPLRVGLAQGSLTTTQVEEALDASPNSESDTVAREQASRPVRNVGIISGVATEETMNDGKPIRTKLKMAIANSADLDMFVRNESGATLTTGAVVEVSGNLYIQWR